MKTTSALLLAAAGSASAFAPQQTGRTSVQVSETKADLEVLAKDLNPIVGFYDPWVYQKMWTLPFVALRDVMCVECGYVMVVEDFLWNGMWLVAIFKHATSSDMMACPLLYANQWIKNESSFVAIDKRPIIDWL
jgi:hypothetical protein